jgi:hypothetical protein
MALSGSAFALSVPVRLQGYTVAGLPTCSAGLKGALVHATDLTAVTYNVAPAGGGSLDAPVYCDGSSWRIH